MSDTRQPLQANKNGLRLIKGGAAKPLEPTQDPMAAASAAEEQKRPKSNLGRLMSAYADAIDRDIALLLDL